MVVTVLPILSHAKAELKAQLLNTRKNSRKQQPYSAMGLIFEIVETSFYFPRGK